MERLDRNVMDYLLSTEQGVINNKKLKIGEKAYKFERNKPLTQRLKTKFNKIWQTIDYKKFELKEKRGLRWINLDKNKTLTGIQKHFKATVTDQQSAFKNYANSKSRASKRSNTSNTKTSSSRNT